jgi:hypothetical protein
VARIVLTRAAIASKLYIMHARGRKPLDRRAWLKLGGLSLGALVSGVEPRLAHLLAAEESGRKPDREFSVILFWANGGPSHLDTFDLKPNAPAEIRGPFRPIRTNVAGIHINERLPRLAQLADKFAIIRSLYHNRAEHSGGTHRFLTGYPSLAANLQNAEYPDIGSIVAKELDGTAGDAPLYIGNTKFYGGGPGYLGSAFAPFMPSPNPLTSTGANTYNPVPLYLTASSRGSLALEHDGAVTLRRRENLMRTLDSLPRSLDQADSLPFDRFQRRAVELLAGPRIREAFDLSRESARVRQRYGDSDWGKDLLTARRLVEAGVRFVQCQANLRLRPEISDLTTWDDHSVNVDIFKAYEERLPLLDHTVSALIEDLHQRGLSEHVLFIFCGEFGRTPRIENQDASRRPGRDHWPRAMSVFLSGGGLKMGQAIGATDSRGGDPISRAMDSNCLLATIYQRFGIDTTTTYSDRSGRPLAILPHGELIRELL